MEWELFRSRRRWLRESPSPSFPLLVLFIKRKKKDLELITNFPQAAGTDGALAPGLSMGYAAANGDAGHSWYENALDSSSWATKSPHNVNYHLLSMLGHRSLEELTLIAKHVTESYYGKKIKYSYWSGCSTGKLLDFSTCSRSRNTDTPTSLGGRQGMVLAQRYPTLYQGIYAVAPAMNWVTFIVAEFYPQIVMKALNYYPAACELNAITAAAVEACDELDGVKDGIISAPGQCKFDPQTIVGQEYDCAGSTRKITTEAAKIASATWSGPKDPDTGKSIWFGLTPDASLPGLDPNFGGLASTTCNEDSTECKPRPFPVAADWIRNWLLKDPEYDLSTIDEEQFHNLLVTSYQEYTSAINTADPDLRRFQKSGGKLLSWHGLHDQVISPNGTSSYHDRVAALVGPNVKDFFRHFEAPGVAHCFGGPGAYPTTGFQDLVRWVEHDEPVEELVGRNIPWPGTDRTKIRPFARILCPWPQVASYKGGDEASLSSFECRDGFDLSKMKKKEEVKAAKDEL